MTGTEALCFLFGVLIGASAFGVMSILTRPRVTSAVSCEVPKPTVQELQARAAAMYESAYAWRDEHGGEAGERLACIAFFHAAELSREARRVLGVEP